MQLLAWRDQGHYQPFGPHRIFCVESGGASRSADPERPALVLIHGFPTASWDFAKLWPALSDHFRVLTADLLGFGFSSKPRHHEYSIAEQADVIEAVAREHGLRHFHVLAHDYGDTVAQELLARDNARTADRRLHSVCFLNGGLFPETHRPRLIQHLLAGPLGPLVSRLMNRASFGRSMTAVFGSDTPPTAEELAGFWALIREEAGHLLFHRLIRYMTERRRHRERWVGALREARCPLALIDGAADPISGAHMVARYRELVGKGYVVELPGIGHYPQIEAPELVLDHYLGWRRRISPQLGLG